MIKRNCFQRCSIEGHAKKIKFDDEKKVCYFWLIHCNTQLNDNKTFIMPVYVIARNKQYEWCKENLKENALVLVDGKIRLNKIGYCVIASVVEYSLADLIDIDEKLIDEVIRENEEKII